MQLNLKKPIIFFDLETTGINITKDRIVEISIIKVMPSGEEVEKTRRINPEMPIPAEATAVHHITDEDVAQCPTFKMVAKDLARIFTGCDIAGFNSNRFDIPMLDQEFQRAGVKFDFSKPRFIDVQTIFHKKEQRNLIAAYKFYCGKDLEEAHSANADTRATYEVLKAQLDRYDDLPNDMEKLSEFSSQNRNVDLMGRLIFNDDRKEVINFGKYKGRLAEEVLRQDPGYYSWILKGDFPQNTKDVFTTIKLRLKNA
ncbi:MAG: 3'-5' exonuclease [Duncaniella sp.]|nr:3'-5' exonuclease [Duncaniella sp.]